MSEVKLQIPQPPSFLFKKERTGLVLNEESIVPMIEKIECVEHLGVCIKYQNVPYLYYGFITPEALYAINQVKKLLLEFVKQAKNPFFILWLLTTNKTNLCQSFNVVFDKIYGAHTFKEEWMCRSAFNVANFAHSVLRDMGVDNVVAKETAFNLGQILEDDNAYRFRAQDLFTELNVEDFKKNPRKEIQRLKNVFQERTTDFVYVNINHFFDIVLLFLPLIKKSLIKNIEFLKQAQFDTNDRYWVCTRIDHYNYLGMTIEERQVMYKERPIVYKSMA